MQGELIMGASYAKKTAGGARARPRERIGGVAGL
jgi:hypothetical protein